MRILLVGLLFVGLPACASQGASTEPPVMGQSVESPADPPNRDATVVVDQVEPDLEPYTLSIEDALVDVEMVPVPSGSLTLQTEDGSEQFAVGPFWMSRTEIPWDLFDVYAFGSTESDEGAGEDAVLRPSKPYGAPDRGYGHRGYAAISMTHLVATEFAEWLSLRTGDQYRIPTEAEWEYACRAGQTESVPADELEDHAWFWDNAFDKTHPIAELAPNEFGLHDMIGNAAEWCTGVDGEPLACGGSFMNRRDEVGCDARMVPTAKWQETDPQIPKSEHWLTDGPFMGFRVIRVPDQP